MNGKVNICDFKKYHKTDKPGVYALKLNADGNLQGFSKEKLQNYCENLTDNILYIGMTGNKKGLTGRIEGNHLSKNASISTLRRTIGWFMNMKINDSDRFSSDEENKISEWLINNAHFEIMETDTKEQAEALEELLIQKINPPFNIDKRKNAIKRSF